MKNMNNDLISRQAAVDAIDAILPVEPMKNEYTQGITCGAALAIEYVKQLPSAQPELITWLLDKIWDEEMWELNWQAFPELLCRKLEKLGYVKRKGDEYERLDQQTGGD